MRERILLAAGPCCVAVAIVGTRLVALAICVAIVDVRLLVGAGTGLKGTGYVKLVATFFIIGNLLAI